MKRSRFTEEQIIGVLKEHQVGVSAADICRRYGISDSTFYATLREMLAKNSYRPVHREPR
jgi:putative transposase